MKKNTIALQKTLKMKTQTGRKYLQITSVTKDLCSECIKDSTIGKEIIQSKNKQKISTDTLPEKK